MTEPTPATAGTPAFLLYGSNKVLTRYPELYRALADRGLVPLVVTGPEERDGRLPALVDDPSHPLSAIAEVAYHERTDLDGILDSVAGWSSRYAIVGGLSIGEYYVEPSTVVNDYLGLRSPGLRAGRVCRNKHHQRLYLREFSPRSVMIPVGPRDADTPVPDLEHGVVKPVGRNSSSGVLRFSGTDELRRHLQTYPEDEVLLVEEYVGGNEVSVEALVQDGRVIFTGITQKFVGDGFVEVGHEVPADLPAAHSAALVEANTRVLALLDFRDGISHAEYKVTDDGRVVLVEIAARFPGDGIVSLYNLATGKALADTIVDVALGRDAAHPAPARYAKQVFVTPPHGTLADVVADEALGADVTWYAEAFMWPEMHEPRTGAPASLRVIMVDKSVGDTVGDLESSFDRALTFVVDAASRDELADLAATVETSIDVRLA